MSGIDAASHGGLNLLIAITIEVTERNHYLTIIRGEMDQDQTNQTNYLITSQIGFAFIFKNAINRFTIRKIVFHYLNPQPVKHESTIYSSIYKQL